MSYKQNRCRKAITLDETLLRMTDAINKLEQIIFESEDENKIINATNALSGLIAKYAKLIEVKEKVEAKKENEQEIANKRMKTFSNVPAKNF